MVLARIALLAIFAFGLFMMSPMLLSMYRREVYPVEYERWLMIGVGFLSLALIGEIVISVGLRIERAVKRNRPPVL